MSMAYPVKIDVNYLNAKSDHNTNTDQLFLYHIESLAFFGLPVVLHKQSSNRKSGKKAAKNSSAGLC